MAGRVLIVLGFAINACGGASPNQRIVNTAASRWQCPADNIEVRKLGADTFRVAGCDHEANYACTNDEAHPSGECVRVSGT